MGPGLNPGSPLLAKKPQASSFTLQRVSCIISVPPASPPQGQDQQEAIDISTRSWCTRPGPGSALLEPGPLSTGSFSPRSPLCSQAFPWTKSGHPVTRVMVVTVRESHPQTPSQPHPEQVGLRPVAQAAPL